jgi:hypothetical protein
MAQTYMMKFDWKNFNISLSMIDAELRAKYPSYAGSQAHRYLELWFTADPSITSPGGQSIKEDVQVWWDKIDVNSPEAIAYQSRDQIKAARDAAKASGINKLKTIAGLSDAEIAALTGG